ncbi:hypothetical protein R1sor_003907 [Riccia sorocarpa]|uniref:Reverse transcriptase zinc-binding domain-containing protein n=1 Tax=Riccia sorocarpa TaxID=122646 RepID=A0ABD3H6B8_9MARC
MTRSGDRTELGSDIQRLLSWIGEVEITTNPLHRCAGWKWQDRNGATDRVGWEHETKWWKSLLHKEVNTAAKLNRKWDAELGDPQWKLVWKLTWAKPSTTREGFWWWRTLWRGFWCGEKALKANEGTPNAMGYPATWFQFEMSAIRCKTTDATLWAIAAEFYRVLWREMNDLVFRNKMSSMPLKVILRETRRSVSAWISSGMPDRQKAVAVRTIETLMQLETKLLSADNRQLPHNLDVTNSGSSIWPPEAEDIVAWSRQQREVDVGGLQEISETTT